MKLLKPGQLPILIFNVIMLGFFAVLYGSRGNYEFLMYIGVIIIILFVILAANKKIAFPNAVLWALTAWGLMHMSGGAFYPGGTLLYKIILIPISEEYGIFRFDQFVHVVGFGAATLAMYYLLKPLLRSNLTKWTALSIVVVMAGLGVGALNEIIEFIAVVIVPETGVGGYNNTSLDLVADLIGALIAIAYIQIVEKKRKIV
ncbi:MAG: hypothetical protein COT81_04945 [Candidatus Buchananbacteria bacterium CG10_big_fil_rev_8_21_14_0_10_42_9]|uniref:DUF2238 domain-containing protein n=1 Tax=Candidatus Buchananbacteria bacterium CG10_big_fil_rev_8_21_14_0_10_42_9 TaxID=1974526 RepID=A0A2H0W090_9BACT|nr:MAG: hypothetical protein COT81_04945 [Candidatus Buchananbacteria bacterium CG10_big_fil_rev_8_21_14_0_10_42_9]